MRKSVAPPTSSYTNTRANLLISVTVLTTTAARTVLLPLPCTLSHSCRRQHGHLLLASITLYRRVLAVLLECLHDIRVHFLLHVLVRALLRLLLVEGHGKVRAPLDHSQVFNLLRLVARRIYESYRVHSIYQVVRLGPHPHLHHFLALPQLFKHKTCRSEALFLLLDEHYLAI